MQGACAHGELQLHASFIKLQWWTKHVCAGIATTSVVLRDARTRVAPTSPAPRLPLLNLLASSGFIVSAGEFLQHLHMLI